jgi:hypothetical protein
MNIYYFIIYMAAAIPKPKSLPSVPTGQANLDSYINTFLAIFGAAAVVVIAYGGFKYVISRGDPEATAKAKNTILYAMIGGAGAVHTSPACQTYTANPFTGNNGLLVRVALLISWVVGIAAVGYILYAGLQFIMSRGDAQKAVNARNTILYASIGLAVAILAQAIIAFSINRLT